MKKVTSKYLFAILSSLMVLAGCQKKESVDVSAGNIPAFELIGSESSGIEFENRLNDDPTGVRNILSAPHYYNGAGLAIGDVNNDGLEDIFFAANELPNRLYINKGNLEFEDVTDRSGINADGKNWSVGAVMADVNGDGWLDIYVCQAGYSFLPDRSQRENMLLINNQDGTFSNKAREYGVNDDNESTSASFFDYDKDGDLDLYVLNESIYAFMIYQQVFEDLKDPVKLSQASGNLYRNDGDKFTKVTREAGVERYGFGLGLVTNDINGDGWTDIYVANDYSVPDFMFINNGDGTFTDSIKEKTKQVSFYGMGCDMGDINNDTLPDIMVVDMAASDHFRDKTLMASMDVDGFWTFVSVLGYQYQYMFNSLQLNNGNGTYSNIAGLAGLLRTDWSWASLFADFDHDMYNDLYVTNGYRRYARDNDFRIEMEAMRNANNGTVPLEKRPEMYAKMPEIEDPNNMFHNNGDLSFSLVTEDWNMNQPSYSNGAAYADLDNDGDLDLVVNNIDAPAFLYKNNAVEKGEGHFIKFRFEGETPGTPVFNTKVTIHHQDQKQYREFHPTRGYASSVTQELHFGTGSAGSLEKVVVEWPDGKVQILRNVKTDQTVSLKHADAVERGSRPAAEIKIATSIDPVSIGLDFVHVENVFNDFDREVLLPHKQTQQGPALAEGDVNGDGLEDLFIGGALNQPGRLYLQKPDGSFTPNQQQPWEFQRASEDVAALFFDAEGDGDLDLYVASGGGGEYPENSPLLQDRLYINFADRGFAAVNALPEMFTPSTVVIADDFSGDGKNDLFVGGGAEPGKYPYPSRSYLLQYTGNRYEDVTSQLAPELERPGMVRDALFTDINGDGKNDLVVVGEWMGVKVFLREENGFRDASEELGLGKMQGWWFSVAASDLDNDGKMDLVVGNLGKNTKFSASEKKPFNVFANDFDENGTVDIVLSKEYHGKLVPARGRQCSSEQMPFIKSKFPTYQQFASADLEDIYGEENLEEALHLQVMTFESAVLMNEGGRFKSIALPQLAQVAPINRILVDDLNGDQIPDLIIAGNMHEAEVETPRYDAGTGLILLGNGKGEFDALPVWRSGLYAAGNVKDLTMVNTNKGPLLIAANNGDKMSVFRIKAKTEQ